MSSALVEAISIDDLRRIVLQQRAAVADEAAQELIRRYQETHLPDSKPSWYQAEHVLFLLVNQGSISEEIKESVRKLYLDLLNQPVSKEDRNQGPSQLMNLVPYLAKDPAIWPQTVEYILASDNIYAWDSVYFHTPNSPEGCRALTKILSERSRYKDIGFLVDGLDALARPERNSTEDYMDLRIGYARILLSRQPTPLTHLGAIIYFGIPKESAEGQEAESRFATRLTTASRSELIEAQNFRPLEDAKPYQDRLKKALLRTE